MSLNLCLSLSLPPFLFLTFSLSFSVSPLSAGKVEAAKEEEKAQRDALHRDCYPHVDASSDGGDPQPCVKCMFFDIFLKHLPLFL